MNDNNNNNINFLDQLKDFNEKNLSKELYIPSLEKTVKFSTLTAKHQKELIHAAIDNPILNIRFHERLYAILKELCHDKDIVDNLTVLDKDAIVIQMRYHFVSKEYNKKDFSGNIEFISNMKLDLQSRVDDCDGISIQYQIPNIKQEQTILKGFSQKNKLSISPSEENEIRDTVASAYIIELMKYVAKVQLIETGAVVDLNIHNYEENRQVIECLGKVVCNKIHNFINDIKNKYESMYKIDDKTQIELNSSLFS